MDKLRSFNNCLTSIPAILVLLASLHASPASAQELLISGVVDGPLSGGTPTAVEVYVVSNILDLSIYGLGSANNGGGSDGEEFTFPATAASAGDFIYIASEAPQFFAFFGFAPDYVDSAASINGDDAIELFKSGVVIDVFGDINVDGTGEPWDYLDGWAYRVIDTGPDGTVFALGKWTFSGPNALDGEATNDTAATPFPLGTYTPAVVDVAPSVSSTTPANGAADVAQDADIEIAFSEAVRMSGTWFDITCNASGTHTGTVSSGDNTTYLIDPDSDFVAGDSCTVTVFAAQVEDLDAVPDNMQADFSFSYGLAATQAQPCEVDDPSGTVTMPPAGCEYLGENGVFQIIDGLPPGTTIELSPVYKDFICNELALLPPSCDIPAIPGVSCEEPGGSFPGGNANCSASNMQLQVVGTGSLTGFARMITVQTTGVVDTAARAPGDPVQSFATEMVALQGQLFGDPDFCVFDLLIGSDLGLAPSLGNTVLTNLGGVSWDVYSFFDTNYRIDFQGCPGSLLEGFGGSSAGQLRLSTGVAPVAPEAVPSLMVPSLALLGTLLAGSALYVVRRRAAA